MAKEKPIGSSSHPAHAPTRTLLKQSVADKRAAKRAADAARSSAAEATQAETEIMASMMHLFLPKKIHFFSMKMAESDKNVLVIILA